MRRILKLTPETIKRIIAEERQKLEDENKARLLEQLRLLKKIKDRQIKSIVEAKELHDAKMLLVKKIKGKK
tara:strand:- start:1257 stop:1469 length:213 start_codon:yes stop_codon:yes gene_type:complete